MIKLMSSWVKGLGLAIVIVSILEMLLPNNKTKKYIRMVMGIYILFTIISPFVSNQEVFNIKDINLEEYVTLQTSTNLDQTSMDARIKELYIQELEKDIIKKLKEKGYEATSCKVKTEISDKEETQITKIKINVNKLPEDEKSTNNTKEQDLENKIVTQIQKIKPIDVSVKENNLEQEEELVENKNTKVSKSDIQNIIKFLMEEYGVKEKCLEIN